jgi:hypothetical protein
MKHKKTVQGYPHWRQIEFKDCTKNRNELNITEKLLSIKVIGTSYTSGGWLRLYVTESYEEALDTEK